MGGHEGRSASATGVRHPYYGAVVLLGLAVLAVVLPAWDEHPADLRDVAVVYAAFALLASVGKRDSGTIAMASFSVGYGAALAALPLPQAVATCLLLVVTAAPPWRRPLPRVVFNIAADAVALTAAAGVLLALGGPAADLPGVARVGLAVLVYDAVNILTHVGVARWVLGVPWDRIDAFDLRLVVQDLQLMSLGATGGLLLVLDQGVLWLLLAPVVVPASQVFALRSARAAVQRDDKTGLLTLAGFRSQVLQEHERARRSGRDLALVMLDVDHFRGVNEEHGHLVGDLVLQAVARAVTQQTRPYDVVGRFGGEEFALALVDLPEDEVRAACERVRAAVREAPVPTPPVTASLGVALWTDGMSLDDALRAADAALYEAKSSGRDRVCLARQERPVPTP